MKKMGNCYDCNFMVKVKRLDLYICALYKKHPKTIEKETMWKNCHDHEPLTPMVIAAMRYNDEQ